MPAPEVSLSESRRPQWFMDMTRGAQAKLTGNIVQAVGCVSVLLSERGMNFPDTVTISFSDEPTFADTIGNDIAFAQPAVTYALARNQSVIWGLAGHELSHVVDEANGNECVGMPGLPDVIAEGRGEAVARCTGGIGYSTALCHTLRPREKPAVYRSLLEEPHVLIGDIYTVGDAVVRDVANHHGVDIYEIHQKPVSFYAETLQEILASPSFGRRPRGAYAHETAA